ncbi:MAG: cytochrome c [Magnetococcus sp. YQC-9]
MSDTRMMVGSRAGWQVWIGLAVWMGALLAASTGWATEDRILPARQAELLHLLRHDCGSCHGMTLKGGLGPALLPENLAGKPLDLLEDIVFHGMPEKAMPPWDGLLTRQEIRWLVERLKKGEIP